MAYVGLAKPTVAKADDGTGTMKYTEGFTCGKAIEVTINPQYAEGSLFADNVKSEYDKEFKWADITLNTDTLPIAAHTVMFGHTVTEDEATIEDKSDDEANYVGFGIYAHEKVSGKKKYVAIWIHKVKFTEGQESYKTKGDNIEYQTPGISGQAVAISNKKWRTRKVFDTEQDARDWIDTMAGIKSAPAPTAEGGN